MPLPDGFVYHEDFLDASEESQLIASIQQQEFSEVRMRGVVARRRVIQYGWLYGYDNWRRVSPGPPLAGFLLPLRERAAQAAGLAAEALGEVLVTEYTPGAVIGWHRDAPMFGTVLGVSLGAPCRLRFRRGAAGAWETAEITAEPRSLYVLDGPARTEWQHSIPAVKALRYSITFRTLRGKCGTTMPI